MNIADLNRIIGREWPLIPVPKKDRRRDADKRVEVDIAKSLAKPWGILSAAKFLRDADVPEEVALRVLAGKTS